MKKMLAVGTVLYGAYLVKNRDLVMKSLDAFKASIRLAKGESPYSMAYVDGVEVFIHDDVITAHNAIYGCVVLNMFHMPIICIHSSLLDAPDYVQQFIVHHEKAHIELGHIRSPESKKEYVAQYYRNTSRTLSRNYKALVGILDKNERDADAYAASKMGKENAILALAYMNYHNYHKQTAKEMELRINHLRKLSTQETVEVGL